MGVAPGGSATLATNGNSIEVTFRASHPDLAGRGRRGGSGRTGRRACSTNWLNVAANSRASYVDGNGVIFNDTLTGTTSVNISAAGLAEQCGRQQRDDQLITPLAASGKITGTTGLTKDGRGDTDSLALANDYTGATTIANWHGAVGRSGRPPRR
jgi:hypothetical protein